MADHSSRPHRSPQRLAQRRERRIIKVRFTRRWGPPLGLEETIPIRWLAWTALAESQLIRLLTDSAPVNRPATKVKDNLVRPIERKDTP